MIKKQTNYQAADAVSTYAQKNPVTTALILGVAVPAAIECVGLPLLVTMMAVGLCMKGLYEYHKQQNHSALNLQRAGSTTKQQSIVETLIDEKPRTALPATEDSEHVNSAKKGPSPSIK